MTHTAARLLLLLALSSSVLSAQKNRDFELTSPDSAISVKVEAGAKLQWSVRLRGEQTIAPSIMSLILEGGGYAG